MKKLTTILLAVIMTASAAVNCLAYTKVKSLANQIDKTGKFVTFWDEKSESINEMSRDAFDKKYPDNGVYNGAYLSYIVTNEYKLINGNAMVKLRNVCSAAAGKIDYNKKTKVTKVYFNKMPAGYYFSDSIRSFSITPGKTKVDFGVVGLNDKKSQGSCNFKIAPKIIDGSLYVSAMDLGELFKYYISHDNQVTTYEERYVNAFLLNGIVYICADRHYAG